MSRRPKRFTTSSTKRWICAGCVRSHWNACGLDAVLAHFVRDRAGLVGALRIDDRDVGAGRGERVADALAEPAIAAGDDRDRILQIHVRPQLT